MNERINTLAEQAGFYVSESRREILAPESNVTEVLREFAELIVEECAQRIDYWESRQGEHCEDLLKHFGVTK
jgi:hypothetical protein